MKTPKEKAEELVEKFYETLPQWVNMQDAKQCAIIAVDEIISTLTPYMEDDDARNYYEQVKQEIQNL